MKNWHLGSALILKITRESSNIKQQNRYFQRNFSPSFFTLILKKEFDYPFLTFFLLLSDLFKTQSDFDRVSGTKRKIFQLIKKWFPRILRIKTHARKILWRWNSFMQDESSQFIFLNDCYVCSKPTNFYWLSSKRKLYQLLHDIINWC